MKIIEISKSRFYFNKAIKFIKDYFYKVEVHQHIEPHSYAAYDRVLKIKKTRPKLE